MNACDCGAATEGKWANIHAEGCASSADPVAATLNSLARIADRLTQAAEIDGPPSLIKAEADLIRRRVGEIRSLLSKEQDRG